MPISSRRSSATVAESKYLAGASGAVSQTLYTTYGALKANIVLQNIGNVSKRVAIAITDPSQTFVVPATSSPALANWPEYLTLERDDSFMVSPDHTRYSTNSGLTWSTVVTDQWYGIAKGPGSYPFRISYIDADTFRVHPYISGNFHSSPIEVTAASQGWGSRLRNYTQEYCRGIVIDSNPTTGAVLLARITSSQLTKLYFAGDWTTSSSRTWAIGNTDSSPIGSTIVISNTATGYQGYLNVESSASGSYGYFETLGDTGQTDLSTSSPLVTDGTTVNRIAPARQYSLVITNNDKACIVSTHVTTTAVPTYTALSALPGGIKASEITGVWAMEPASRWVIKTSSRLFITANLTALTWTEQSISQFSAEGLTNSAVSTPYGIGYRPSGSIGPTAFWGSTLSSSFNASLGSTEDFVTYSVNGTTVNRYISSTLSNMKLAESYTISGGHTIELSDRVYAPGTTITVIAQDVGINESVLATIYGSGI